MAARLYRSRRRASIRACPLPPWLRRAECRAVRPRPGLRSRTSAVASTVARRDRGVHKSRRAEGNTSALRVPSLRAVTSSPALKRDPVYVSRCTRRRIRTTLARACPRIGRASWKCPSPPGVQSGGDGFEVLGSSARGITGGYFKRSLRVAPPSVHGSLRRPCVYDRHSRVLPRVSSCRQASCCQRIQ